MMKKYFIKILFVALLVFTVGIKTAGAQKPVGFSNFLGNYIDYWTLHNNIAGDTYGWQGWASNSLLPLFPDPTGLPLVTALNDGANSLGCTGNILTLQLSKLPSPLTAPTAGNTLITSYPCLSSFGGAPGDTGSPSSTWAGHLTGGDAYNSGTWKGANMAFRNNILLFAPYRQTAQGSAFGDSTLTLSPDAGQTWIDYGRYNTYTVTGASCAASVVTLNVANALVGNEKIYIHNVVPSGYNGKQTLTSATAGTVTFTLKNMFGVTQSCPGAYSSGGAFGLLSANGSAPLGPSDASYPADMMWPVVSGHNPMTLQLPINYGQDGSYPTGVDTACDPTVYLCGFSIDATYLNGLAQMPVILYRVPVGQEMIKASYQWYTCTGYVANWAVGDSVCDGNLPGSWTSTVGSATVLFYTRSGSGGGYTPNSLWGIIYNDTFKSYILSMSVGYLGMNSYKWAPHPWGPYNLIGSYPCISANCNGGFQTIMGYGENIISTNPIETQLRLSNSVDLGVHAPGGNPGFDAVDMKTGRVPVVGMARRADFIGGSGQLGMGHKFTTGSMAGAISRRGLAVSGGSYSLDWWTDLWDHGGNTLATGRPFFRDIISGGSKYFNAMFSDAGEKINFGHGMSLQQGGVYMSEGGYSERLQSSFTDTVTTGNTQWTYVGVFNRFNIATMGYIASVGNTNELTIMSSKITPGDVCVGWHSSFYSTHTVMCTPAVVAINTWYFVAVSAKTTGSGYPTITIYIGSAGTMTEYGGISMALSPTGTTAGNLTKTCPISGDCSTFAAVAAAPILLGGMSWNGGSYGSQLLGTLGESGLYSGVVPGNVIREIYKTLRTDWARVGRGAL